MTQDEARHCLRQRPGLLIEEFDDELVVCDPDREEVILLNPMAAAIWELCDGSRTAGEIVEDILACLSADRGEVLADVQRLLGEMERRGFLVAGVG